MGFGHPTAGRAAYPQPLNEEGNGWWLEVFAGFYAPGPLCALTGLGLAANRQIPVKQRLIHASGTRGGPRNSSG